MWGLMRVLANTAAERALAIGREQTLRRAAAWAHDRQTIFDVACDPIAAVVGEGDPALHQPSQSGRHDLLVDVKAPRSLRGCWAVQIGPGRSYAPTYKGIRIVHVSRTPRSDLH
jgi:hypothetical protein